MFSVGLFYTALGVLLAVFGFRHIETSELGDSAKYFAQVRSVFDKFVAQVYAFLVRHFSFDAVTQNAVHVYHVVQHYTARMLAQLGHMLEHRARRVVHRTAKRVRTGGHYLERATNGTTAQVEKAE